MPGGSATCTVARVVATPRPRHAGQASTARVPAPAHAGQVSGRGTPSPLHTVPSPPQYVHVVDALPRAAPLASHAAHGDSRSTERSTATPLTAWWNASSTGTERSSPRRPFGRV